MKKALGALGFVLIFAIAGLALGIWVGAAQVEGQFIPWEPDLLSDGQVASHFVFAEETNVYVETSQGKVYIQSLSEDLPSDWQEAQPRVAEASRGYCHSGSQWRILRSPPGKIRERLECLYYVHPEYYISFRYVILENGEVWRWRHDQPGLGSFVVPLLFGLVGIIGGGLIGLLMFELLLWARGRSIDRAETIGAAGPSPSFPAQPARPIRRTQSFTCPQCGAESHYDPNIESARCPQCGYHPPPVDTFIRTQRHTQALSRHCHRCGREIGRQLLDCPERSSGSCPFVEETGDASGGCLKLLGVGMLLYAMVLLASLINPGEEEPPWILAILCLPILVFMGTGLLFGKRQTLRNPETGQFWQRHSIFGLETDRKLVTGLEQPELNLVLPRPFEDPISIVALGIDTRKPTGYFQVWTNYATDVFTATLVGMLAEGSIEVRYARTQRSYMMSPYYQRNEYLITPGQGSNIDQNRSYLEERILNVVKTKQPYYTPTGIGIYDMVYAVYESDQPNPGGWLVQKIREEAAERELGNLSGSGRKRQYEPNARYADRLQQQSQILQALCDQLEKSHPSLMTAFRVHIQRAMQSRTPDTAS